jgi:hypothetical protein
MRKRLLAVLAGIIVIHDLATLYTIGHLWGLSLMHSLRVNPIEEKIWKILFSILSLPILRVVSNKDISFSIYQMYIMSTLNSIVAVCIGYYFYRWCKRIMRSQT